MVKETIIFINIHYLFGFFNGKMSNETKVKVYSAPVCPWCTRAKNFLEEHNIKFEDFDVSLDEKAKKEMAEKSGQMGVPVIDINGEIIIGFDAERIKKLLDIKD